MKKTISHISIIVFIIAFRIVSSLNTSNISLGAPISKIKTQKINISEPSEIKKPDASLEILKPGNERFQKDE